MREKALLHRTSPIRPLGFLVAGVILAPGFASAIGLIPAVSFTQESIRITVRPESINVEGIYVYANRWLVPRVQNLLNPFPVDETHPRPATLSVSEINPDNGAVKREIPVLWAGAEPAFIIQIMPLGETHVRVRYTQRATDSSATYILTSTQPWGRELEYGEYFLVPNGVRITGSNYPLEERGEHLAFVRRQFMPHEDWRFTWTQSDPTGENE